MAMNSVWLYAHQDGCPQLVRADEIDDIRLEPLRTTTGEGAQAAPLMQLQALARRPRQPPAAPQWFTLAEWTYSADVPEGLSDQLRCGLASLSRLEGGVVYAAVEVRPRPAAGTGAGSVGVCWEATMWASPWSRQQTLDLSDLPAGGGV